LQLNIIFICKANYQKQITTLSAEVLKLRKELNATRLDLIFDESDINYLFADVNRMKKEETYIRNNITEIKNTLLRLNDVEFEVARIDDLRKKFDHLHNVNQMWRKNFKSINATIHDLRKKKMIR